jgi:hypothetical protein
MISIREGRRSRGSIWRPSRLFDFVGPFVHMEFAIEEELLALLNELAEILGGSTPYLEVDKSGDLLFLPLNVGEVLVVGDGCRQNSFPARGVSEFGSAMRLPVGSTARSTSPTCTRVSSRNLLQHRYETRSLSQFRLSAPSRGPRPCRPGVV